MSCHSLQMGHGISGRLRRLFSMSFSTSNNPMQSTPLFCGARQGTVTSQRRPFQKFSTNHFTSRVSTDRKATGNGARTVIRTSLPMCSSKARPL